MHKLYIIIIINVQDSNLSIIAHVYASMHNYIYSGVATPGLAWALAQATEFLAQATEMSTPKCIAIAS